MQNVVFANEGMFHELVVLWPVLVVLREAAVDETPELLGEERVRRKRWRIVLYYSAQYLQ